MRIDPLTRRKLRRFREIRRGYYSFLLLAGLLAVSAAAELLVNDRALAVRYDGEWVFPTYGPVRLGAEFGLTGAEGVRPVDYRTLQADFRAAGGEHRVIMPLIPWGPYASDAQNNILRAEPPDWERRHLLGTDSTGRDILARLFYGFRTAIVFALAFTALTYLIG